MKNEGILTEKQALLEQANRLFTFLKGLYDQTSGNVRTNSVLAELSDEEANAWDAVFNMRANLEVNLRSGMLFVANLEDFLAASGAPLAIDSDTSVKPNLTTHAIATSGKILDATTNYRVSHNVIGQDPGLNERYKPMRVESVTNLDDIRFVAVPHISATHENKHFGFDIAVYAMDKYGRLILSIFQDYRSLMGRRRDEVLLNPHTAADAKLWFPVTAAKNDIKPISPWFDSEWDQNHEYKRRAVGIQIDYNRMANLTESDIPDNEAFAFIVRQMAQFVDGNVYLPEQPTTGSDIAEA